ncbi:MAG: 3'-5' exonuclease [Bacillota bacterium]
MEYLIFDTETTGLPKSWQAPITKLDNWPRMVQLAWVLYNEDGKVIQRCGRIIKPEGFVIPDQVAKIHGISTARALAEGVPVKEALTEFCRVLERRRLTLVAHNIDFDEKVVGAELLRAGIRSEFFNLPKICTMKSAIEFCNLPGKKYPRLAELYFKLFGDDFQEAHRADADATACGKCFFELKKKKIV